ncbi:MAG: DNA-binding protein [Thermodesulfobacteriota bacterium]
MKKIMVLLAMALSLALVYPVLAQPGPGGGMGMGGGMGPRLYNPQTVTTVTGQVEKVEEITMGPPGGMGMKFRELLLKTDKGNLMVHLGPNWYLDQQKFIIKAGDKLEVTGSQVTLNNQPAIIARSVQMNGKTLKLRDEQGLPAWRRMGGGGMGQGRGPGGM